MSMKEKELYNYIKTYFYYNNDDGWFYWKKIPKYVYGVKIGDKIGCIDKYDNYIRVGIKNKIYKAHRLVWLYVYGFLPKNHIDHINGDRTDNRIKNLRDIPQKDNNRNAKCRKDNKSGFTGVSFKKTAKKKKWFAYISYNGKRINIGYFYTAEDAYKARKSFEQALKYHKNHGRKDEK